MITEKDVKFVFANSLSESKAHHLLYRDKKHGLQCEIHTPVIADHGGYHEFGKQQSYFYIDGDKREFKTLKGMLKAYNKLKAAK